MVENNRDRAARIENELLKKLLALPRTEEPDKDLECAVRLLVEVLGATTAYLELVAGDSPAPGFMTGHDAMGRAPAETISRGVIARAIAEQAVIQSSSARGDPRFRDLGSVRRYEIEAIVCAPIEIADVVGAVCVQRSGRAGVFSDCELRVVEYFAQQLALVARRLVPPSPVVPLREEIKRVQANLVREALARSRGNVAQAARELKVARSFVYSVVRPTRRRTA
jgi:transcriptional regulator with GAF, ATPase, and Fis domain